MSRFSSREEAYEYNRRVTEISERWSQAINKAKGVMSKEDLDRYSELVTDPIPTREMAELLVKYKLLNPKYICPREQPE